MRASNGIGSVWSNCARPPRRGAAVPGQPTPDSSPFVSGYEVPEHWQAGRSFPAPSTSNTLGIGIRRSARRRDHVEEPALSRSPQARSTRSRGRRPSLDVLAESLLLSISSGTDLIGAWRPLITVCGSGNDAKPHGGVPWDDRTHYAASSSTRRPRDGMFVSCVCCSKNCTRTNRFSS